VPALEPYIIEPIWEQFEALLPERRATCHPLGCHRPRVPDHVVFGKLVQILVFGCSYRQDRRRVLLGEHAASRARRVDSLRAHG